MAVRELRDSYVAVLMRMPMAKIPPDIIELKRKQVELKRILIKHKQENTNG